MSPPSKLLHEYGILLPKKMIYHSLSACKSFFLHYFHEDFPGVLSVISLVSHSIISHPSPPLTVRSLKSP